MKYLGLMLLLVLAACSPQAPDPGLVDLPQLAPRLQGLYGDHCGRCHGRDLAGTPRTGRPSDWQVRAEKGLDQLTRNVISGYRGMPPMGMCRACGEDEIRALVAYMLTGTEGLVSP